MDQKLPSKGNSSRAQEDSSSQDDSKMFNIIFFFFLYTGQPETQCFKYEKT